MTAVDTGSNDLTIFFSILAVVLIFFAIIYAISEIINWNKPSTKPTANKLDKELYKLKLRPKTRAPRLCGEHLVQTRTTVKISVLDTENCEMCVKK